ncbi:hypothetical protein ACIQI8_29210 [Streptomyces sp. NPDC092369]|uniref:hypothetical protein n=1 Tax=Streptomyces sp. NPDC092369 TaxID=3366015 RepID=UPI0037F6D938
MTAPHERTARSGRDLRILRAAVFAAVCVVLAGAGHAFASCATVPLWTLLAGFLGVVLVAAPLAGRERSLPGIAALLALGQTVLHTLFGLGQHGMTNMAGTTSGSASSMASMSTTDMSLVERAARIVCGTTAAAISPTQARQILSDARLTTDPTAGMSGMDMGSMHHPADALAGAGSAASLLPSLPMLLAHVLAGIAAGWLLRRGDLAVRRLVELSAVSLTEGALVRSLRAALALVRALRAGLPATPETVQGPPRTALLAAPRPRTTALQHSVIRRGPPAADARALALAA